MSIFIDFTRGGLRKEAPISRAARIQQDSRLNTMLDQPPHVYRELLRTLRQINQQLQNGPRNESTFRNLAHSLNSLPNWQSWTPNQEFEIMRTIERIQKFIDPSVQTSDAARSDSRRILQSLGVPDDTDEKQSNDADISIVLERKLTEYTGVPFISQNALQNSELAWMFYRWLVSFSAPGHLKCHVRDIDGQWIDNLTMRSKLSKGLVVHLEQRQLVDPKLATISPLSTPPLSQQTSPFRRVRSSAGVMDSPAMSEGSDAHPREETSTPPPEGVLSHKSPGVMVLRDRLSASGSKIQRTVSKR